jgi:hypothetical protein
LRKAKSKAIYAAAASMRKIEREREMDKRVIERERRGD